jgi:general stress protein 26
MDRSELYRFMRQHRYGVVSSIAADGLPQSALVGIATTPDLSIVFDTLRTTRKYANLTRNPRCSFVVGWSGEQTVQFEGIAEEPIGDDLLRYQAAYFAVWPDGPARMRWPNLTYLVVHPRWLRYSDYDQSPPFIWEFAV